MRVIRLSSKEDEIFEVDMEVAKMSVTIKTMLEDLGNDDDSEIIRVPRIDSAIMRVVVDWCNHHAKEAAALAPESEEDDTDNDDDYDCLARKSDDIDPWDMELMKPLDTVTLFELVMASNYLNIKGLQTLVSKTIANLIKGKTPQEIRDVFNIGRRPADVDDNTEEEEGGPE